MTEDFVLTSMYHGLVKEKWCLLTILSLLWVTVRLDHGDQTEVCGLVPERLDLVNHTCCGEHRWNNHFMDARLSHKSKILRTHGRYLLLESKNLHWSSSVHSFKAKTAFSSRRIIIVITYKKLPEDIVSAPAANHFRVVVSHLYLLKFSFYAFFEFRCILTWIWKFCGLLLQSLDIIHWSVIPFLSSGHWS